MSNGSLDAKTVTMTPERAAKIIKKHMAVVEKDDSKKNRKVSERAIEKYATDMKAGHWQLNAETVKIAEDGQILDGQHRLLACVQANTPFQTLLVEGVTADAFQSIDIGVPRTGGNLLYLAGHKNTTQLASALTLLWRWEAGGGRQFDRWPATPSKQELFEILERHPEIHDFVRKAHTNVFKSLASVGLIATLWYLFSQRDKVLADAFFDALGSGVGLKADDPVYVLRERLLKERQATSGGRGGRMTMALTADFMLRAWNATRKNEKLQRLNVPRNKTGGKGVFKLQNMNMVEAGRKAKAGKPLTGAVAARVARAAAGR